MAELTMPSLGADMTAGRLLEWLVKPGQEVRKGDLIAVVDTDKAEIEIESFHDGVVGEFLVAEGEKVPVGTVLATITDNGAVGGEPRLTAEESGPTVAEEPPAPAPEPAPEPEHHRVSPLARRLGRDLGVDVDHLAGTGPHGSVVRADVEAAAAEHGTPTAPAPAPPSPPAPAPEPAAEPTDKSAAMRRAIADLMARSNREIPHYHLGTHVDLTNALAYLADLNAERPIQKRILPAALLLQATARAAAANPALNGFWEDGAFRAADGVHLGVAISLRGGGLVAPAIHDADTLSLDELMDALRDLVKRARAGRMRGAEMRDPTLTVTNLGDQGVETVHGVIYPPQVALVGFGRITERPSARDGMVGAHPVVHATLAADHRASDGHVGGLFLADIERRLQEPSP